MSKFCRPPRGRDGYGTLLTSGRRARCTSSGLAFHPLDLAEDAPRSLLGFIDEGIYLDDDPELAAIALAGIESNPDAVP